MATTVPSISLGFAHQAFPPGVHVCQIFSDDDERQESLLAYLASGLKNHEKACCFSEKVTEDQLDHYLNGQGLDYGRAKARGDLALSPTREIYFQDNCFDPDRMLSLLREFYRSGVEGGYTASRVIGEMTPEVQTIKGGSRLFEYESRVSMLLKTHPVTAVCQYDARSFDGATIMDILKVHPFMIVRGSVVQNPFFIPPEVYLSR